MSQRREFAMFAQAEEPNDSALCARYGISRKTGYRWLRRFGADGYVSLAVRISRA